MDDKWVETRARICFHPGVSAVQPTDNNPACAADISAPTFRRGLVCLFLFGLAARAAFMVAHARSPSFGVLTLDQKYYDTVARMILAGEDLRQLHGMRPLLYPLFLAALDKIGGARAIDLTLAVQHLLGILTGLFAAIFARKLFRNNLCGLAAGLLYLLAPIPLSFEGEVLIEPFYVYLICGGLLLLFYAARCDGKKAAMLWCVSGAWLMLTAQARPNILVFLAVFPVMAIRGRRAALLGLLGAALMAVPWGFVNKMQSDGFHVLPTAGGVNFYFGNKRGADGMQPEQGRRVTSGERYEDSGEVWARQEYAAALRAQGRQPDSDPMAVSRFWTQRTLAEIKAAPGAWLTLLARKCWLMLWNTEIPNNKSFAFEQGENFWLRALPTRWVVLLMLAPAGIWAAARRGNRDDLAILLTYILLYGAGNIAFFICDRYRYPIWPAMAVLAGGGLMTFCSALQGRLWRRAAFLTASFAAMALISVPNWIGAKLPTFARDYLFRSIAWYEKGHFPEALQDIDRSLELDPGDINAIQQRGNILLAMSQWDAARQDFAQIAPRAPDDAGIWNDYGLALEGSGRTNEAIQAFTRATACHPPSRRAFLSLAFAQIRAGQLTAAADALNRLEAIEKAPDAIALALRSVLARRQGDLNQSVALEKQARALDPAATEWALQRLDR